MSPHLTGDVESLGRVGFVTGMASSEFAHHSPTWNAEQFFQICGADKELAVELINLYRQQFDQSFQKLKNAVNENDLQNAVLFSHDIKGASVNLGCQDVSTHSYTLEKLARDGRLLEMKGLFDGLQDAQTKVSKILDEVLDNFPEEEDYSDDYEDDEDDDDDDDDNYYE